MKDENVDLSDELTERIRSLFFGKPDLLFWDGLDEAYLKARFYEASAAEFHNIVPVWDLRPEAMSFNDVVPDALVGANLYMADRESLLNHCADAEIYCHAAYKKYSGEGQVLKVAGQWLRGDALTPPLFYLDSDWKLRKVDGHHRATVAFLAETPVFPFYCQEALDLPGIDRASSEHLTQSRWTTKPGARPSHSDPGCLGGASFICLNSNAS